MLKQKVEHYVLKGMSLNPFAHSERVPGKVRFPLCFGIPLCLEGRIEHHVLEKRGGRKN